MKNIKLIMNPMRINVLKYLQKRGETNINGLGSGDNLCYSREQIKRAFDRFVELEFIKFTGGGYFEISEKGIEYLKGCDN